MSYYDAKTERWMPGDPPAPAAAPQGSGQFANPTTGAVDNLGTQQNYFQPDAMDPNAFAGGRVVGAALSDPGSGLSNMNYYGGSEGAAAAQYGRQSAMAQGYGARAPIQNDWRNANESAGIQNEALGGLARAVAGDKNSVAQRQLASGYAASTALANSQAAGARGGLAARASALRGAGTLAAANRGNQAVASSELMNTEQMAAMPQLAGLANAVRGQSQQQAFADANLDQQNFEGNQIAALAARGRGLRVGQMGMQGTMNRQDMRLGLGRSITGTQQQLDQSRRSQATTDINTGLAAGTAGLSGLGRITQRSDAFGGNEKNDDGTWKGYGW